MAQYPLPDLQPGTLVRLNPETCSKLMCLHGYIWTIVGHATESRWFMGEGGEMQRVEVLVQTHREDDRDGLTWLYRCKSLATGQEVLVYCEDIELQGATNNVR